MRRARLFGVFDQLGVAASVQGDEDPEHFAGHFPLGSDVPYLDE